MQEAAAILGPQDRTQGRCAPYLPDDDGFLRAGDEAEAELLVALERDISRLRHLLGLRGAPLPRVLVRGGLVDVAETGGVVDINMMRLVVV